ncbi:MAG: carbohydrate-binding domain-containing protein [Clostridia bacterium]|nr:carbohydrate-binding domain-containing protein [Clostridia bacterium]
MKRTSNYTKFLSVVIGLAMLFTLVSPAFAADGYTASFTVEGGDATVNVYFTQDLTTPDETNVSSAVARSSDTGEIDTTGDGQINFVVVPAEGCTATVTATGNYKNLKTVAENAYRLTKVTGDVAVTITVAAAGETDTSDPVITFTDSAATLTSGSAAGVTINGTAVKINEAGTYTFTGSCANGSIVVKKGVTGVTLILDGLTLTAHATAPITCNKGSGVTIVAAAGSVNNLADDQYNNDDIYTDETLYPDIENAVIKCKDGSNVTICGTGTINVNAYGKNGVKGGADLYEEDADGNYTDTLLSTASLTIEDVTLNVSIKHSYKDPEDATSYDGDAIKSEKALDILSGNITVSANDDGIKCDYTLNIGAAGTDGPTINVTKAIEGIEGSVVNVYSGNVYVTATDDGINAANGDIADRSADFSYNQYGGYVYVNVTNGDALDSNGSVNLAGGTLEVYAPSQGDGDPIDTEMGCTFGGATVLAVGHAMMQQSYSGTYVTFGGNGGMGGFGGKGGFGNMGGMGAGGTAILTADGKATITDASGNTVYTSQSAAPRDASYVVFASPALTSGGSYTLNGSTTATAGTSNGGGNMGPGGQGGFPGNGEQPSFPGNGEQPSFPGNGEQPTQPGTGETTVVPGDVDGDGEVTAADARLALRASVGLETYATGSREALACDVDRDGQITSADARLILRASVGLETLSV